MAFEFVSNTTLASPAANITITGIPQDGVELLFRWSLQSYDTAGIDDLNIRIITDTGTEVTTQHETYLVRGNNYNEAGDDFGNYAYLRIQQQLNGNQITNSFASGEVRFGDYTLSIVNDPKGLMNSQANATSQDNTAFAILGNNTSYKIGGLKFYAGGGNLAAGSSVDVYKITTA